MPGRLASDPEMPARLIAAGSSLATGTGVIAWMDAHASAITAGCALFGAFVAAVGVTLQLINFFRKR